MDYTDIRKLTLKIFLGFLGLTAVIAIISVLIGEFGELQGKILITCLAISAASICSMSCAAFIEQGRHKMLGLSGSAFSIVGIALLIAGMWLDADSEIYWKTSASLTIAGIAFAHGFLLVLPKLDNNQKWVQRVSTVSIAILAFQIILAVCGEVGSEGYYRVLAVVAIIVGLETLTIPMLMKLRKGDSQKKQMLVLEKVDGNIYVDPEGKKYQLSEISPEQKLCTS